MKIKWWSEIEITAFEGNIHWKEEITGKDNALL
jgi:hypothetical protein